MNLSGPIRHVNEPQMHRQHQGRRRGCRRREILCIPRIGARQTWWHTGRHQEATSSSQKCIYQTTEHLEVTEIQQQDQAAYPELQCAVCVTVWGRYVENNDS